MWNATPHYYDLEYDNNLSQVNLLSGVKQVHQGTNFRHCEIWEEDLLALARAFQ